MLYEAAWTYRLLGADSAARAITPADQAHKSDDKAKENVSSVGGSVSRSAHRHPNARFELAELLAERGENDSAIKLLNEALDKEPGQELADRIRLRLGACYGRQKRTRKSALAQFDAVARNAKSPSPLLRPTTVPGKVFLELGDFAQAGHSIGRFFPRSAAPTKCSGSDRSRPLLRLGTCVRKDQAMGPEPAGSRTTDQSFFPQTPWIHEARYVHRLGLAETKNNTIKRSTFTKPSNRLHGRGSCRSGAQLNIGMCRPGAETIRGNRRTRFLIVLDDLRLSGADRGPALTEAARAYAAMKETCQSGTPSPPRASGSPPKSALGRGGPAATQ